MSLSASQCSKGCESGWTVYLGESSSHLPVESNGGGRKSKADDDDDGEEENLSMVSDASSGPPSHEVEDDYSNERCSTRKCRSKSKGKNKGAKGEQHQKQHLSYYYEDTACSPHLKCTEKEKTESENFHRNKNSASAPPEKANSGRKGGLKNRKWA